MIISKLLKGIGMNLQIVALNKLKLKLNINYLHSINFVTVANKLLTYFGYI